MKKSAKIRSLMEEYGKSNLKERTSPKIVGLRRVLGLDLHNATVDEVRKCIRKLDRKSLEHVLSVCTKVLGDDKIGLRENDSIRIAAILAIVAAVPHSERIMQRLIANTSNRNAYEIHFSLFCYLAHMPNTTQLCSLMLDHVESYLRHVSKNTAKAAWMVGDLLGDHWPLKKTLPVLLKLAQEAKYVAGRDAALYGLRATLANSTLTESSRKQVIVALKDISKNDRSETVRSTARFIYEKPPKKIAEK